MNLPKLNSQGVAHHFLLALIVVGVALGGTYYLVASKADSISYKNGRIWQGTYSIAADGSQKIPTSFPSNLNNQSAVMSPDGTTVAF